MTTKEKEEMALVISDIKEFYTDRRATVKAQRSINSQATSFIARQLYVQKFDKNGEKRDETKKERKKRWNKARSVMSSIENGKKAPKGIDGVVQKSKKFVTHMVQGRLGIDNHRKNVESSLNKLAKKLPIYKWVTEQMGLGIGGLWVIVGEAGDLSKYPNPGKLWKRMGLAVSMASDKHKQGWVPSHLKDEARAQAWIEEKYSPQRRSAIWTLGASFLKCKKSKYYQLYDKILKKENARTDENKPKNGKHAVLRAQRYAEKRMILDYWKEWNKDDDVITPEKIWKA